MSYRSSTCSNTKNPAEKRIKRELMEYKKSTDEKSIFHIEVVDDNIFNLKGHIYGPINSSFEGGIFKIEAKIPNSYPFSPPSVKFVTRIWHPNISSQTGTICLDIFKEKWAATMTLRTVMLSLQALLTSPEPDDPQDAVVARQYKESITLYKQTAAYWTLVFANEGPGATNQVSTANREQFAEFESKVEQLMNERRCLNKTTAINALSCNGWNVSAALRSF